ncbi:MAG: hypothetical protein V4550_14805 [Gemmatimonadota bacterium]
MQHTFTRRQLIGSAIAALVLPWRTWAQRRDAPGPHPTPRAGITGAKVLTAEQLGKKTELIPLFDAVREAPEIVDGIRCNCGCASFKGFYSLLSCYEGEAMARECAICQGQGRLATRLHKAGKTLDEIRAAVDAKFG